MLVVLLLTLGSGWFLSNAVTTPLWTGPRWARYLGDAALAFLFGPGFASILYVVMVIANGLLMSDVQAPSGVSPGAVYRMLGLLLVVSIAAWWRLRGRGPEAEGTPRHFPWTWVLVSALAVAAVFLVLDFQAATKANPDGEWDASAIW